MDLRTDLAKMSTLPHTLTAADVSLQVSSPLIRTEKRITPSWTVGQLKGRLETVTGIPPGSMRLVLHVPGRGEIEMGGDEVHVGTWISGLGPNAGEIVVCAKVSCRIVDGILHWRPFNAGTTALSHIFAFYMSTSCPRMT